MLIARRNMMKAGKRPDIHAVCFTALAAGSTVKLTSVYEASSDQPVYNHPNERHYLPRIGLEYSIDGGRSWRTFLSQDVEIVAPHPTDSPITSEVVTLPEAGAKVYIRASRPNATLCSHWGSQVYWKFVATGRVVASGDVTTLLDPAGLLVLPNDFCFACLFRGCTSLVTAPDLPATVLRTDCYLDMFRECTSLVSAPDLPAEALLPYCYQRLFWGCTSLASPPVMAATTLAQGCCQTMFYGCKALTSSPYLLAESMATNCYYQMFRNCSKLATVSTRQTSFAGCDDWMLNVASAGTFTCPASLGSGETITRGTSACPAGWTVVNLPNAT